MSHLSSTSPSCRGGTRPRRLHGSDAVNVLYPRWGISMRRRTGAAEVSGHRILSLSVRFSPNHGMIPEPLLTAPGNACKPARAGTRDEIRTYRLWSAHLSSWRTRGTHPPKRVPRDHPMTLSGAGRTVGYQRRQRDEREVEVRADRPRANRTAFICGPNDLLPDRPGLRRRTRAGEPEGAGIRGDLRRLDARCPALVAGVGARVASFTGDGFDWIFADMLLT
jgi:hypothetical protein